jgi:hypothetical protein
MFATTGGRLAADALPLLDALGQPVEFLFRPLTVLSSLPPEVLLVLSYSQKEAAVKNSFLLRPCFVLGYFYSIFKGLGLLTKNENCAK